MEIGSRACVEYLLLYEPTKLPQNNLSRCDLFLLPETVVFSDIIAVVPRAQTKRRQDGIFRRQLDLNWWTESIF